MNYEILIGALALIGMIAGIVSPIIKLNNNITALTASVESLKEIIQELKDRITSHGHEIDDIKVELANHEARLRTLEK